MSHGQLTIPSRPKGFVGGQVHSYARGPLLRFVDNGLRSVDELAYADRTFCYYPEAKETFEAILVDEAKRVKNAEAQARENHMIWKTADSLKLVAMKTAGRTSKECAEVLGRTVNAVDYRMIMLRNGAKS